MREKKEKRQKSGEFSSYSWHILKKSVYYSMRLDGAEIDLLRQPFWKGLRRVSAAVSKKRP